MTRESAMALSRERYAWARNSLRTAREWWARGRADWALDDIQMAETWRDCAREMRHLAATLT